VAELIKHIRVVWRLWRISFQRAMEFRWQFASSMLNSAVSVGLSILMFDVAYARSPEICGWSKHQTLLLIGIFQLYATALEVFLWPNIGQMSTLVFHGELDGLLVKPVNAQVLVSLRNVNFAAAPKGLMGFAVIVYALSKLGVTPSASGIACAAGMLLAGLASVYALWFISMTLEFWFQGLWSWSYFVPNVFQFAQYPEGIYKGGWRVLFLTVAPVIVVANFPTKALLGELALQSALYSLGLAVVLLVLSHLQWRFSLRRYTSASS
jgi:ABC-2 type transport system permease protein